MNDLIVTLVQTELFWEDAEANRKHFSELFKQIEFPTDLIVLPEMFSTGFSMNTTIAETIEGETIAWIKTESAKLNIPICGSLMMNIDSRFVNRFVWVNPDGTSHHYDKRHLFRMAHENNHFDEGTERIIINYKGWKLFPLVCYDLRFPVWSRRTSSFDYDAIILVANWPERREHHWRTLLMARAIENQSYVVGVNRVGVDDHQISYSGYSGLISPKGEWIHSLVKDSFVQNIVLQKSELTDWRNSFPAWQDADNFNLQ